MAAKVNGVKCCWTCYWYGRAIQLFTGERTEIGQSIQPPDPAPSGIEALVCRDIAARQQMGIKKYGRTVEESSDDMLRHLYEELLDAAVYARAELERRGR